MKILSPTRGRGKGTDSSSLFSCQCSNRMVRASQLKVARKICVRCEGSWLRKALRPQKLFRYQRIESQVTECAAMPLFELRAIARGVVGQHRS